MELLIRLNDFISECRQNNNTIETHITKSKCYNDNLGYEVNERLNNIVFRFADNKEPYQPRLKFNSKYKRAKDLN